MGRKKRSTHKRVAYWIAHYRKKANWNKQQLADMLHVCYVTVWNWENRKTQPCLDDLEMLASTLGVSIELLFQEIPSEMEGK
jgi:transcriptional regulator with XRE-family HTH domain